MAVLSRVWVRPWRSGSFPGVVLAVASLCLSLTPSLLPRTWLVQGVVSGVSAVLGYAVGVFAGWVGVRLVPVLRRPECLSPDG